MSSERAGTGYGSTSQSSKDQSRGRGYLKKGSSQQAPKQTAGPHKSSAIVTAAPGGRALYSSSKSSNAQAPAGGADADPVDDTKSQDVGGDRGTQGFESPKRQVYEEEIAQDEVRHHLMQQRFSREVKQAVKAPALETGQANSHRPGARALALEPGHANSHRQAASRRLTDDVAPPQGGGFDQSAPKVAAGPRTEERKGRGQQLSAEQMEYVTRDVAARIIQTYYKEWKEWKMQVRREAEQRTLANLLGGALGEDPYSAEDEDPHGAESHPHAATFPRSSATSATARSAHATLSATSRNTEENSAREGKHMPARRGIQNNPNPKKGLGGARPSTALAAGGRRQDPSSWAVAGAKERQLSAGGPCPSASAAPPGPVSDGIISRRKSAPGGHTVYTISAIPHHQPEDELPLVVADSSATSYSQSSEPGHGAFERDRQGTGDNRCSTRLRQQGRGETASVQLPTSATALSGGGMEEEEEEDPDREMAAMMARYSTRQPGSSDCKGGQPPSAPPAPELMEGALDTDPGVSESLLVQKLLARVASHLGDEHQEEWGDEEAWEEEGGNGDYASIVGLGRQLGDTELELLMRAMQKSKLMAAEEEAATASDQLPSTSEQPPSSGGDHRGDGKDPRAGAASEQLPPIETSDSGVVAPGQEVEGRVADRGSGTAADMAKATVLRCPEGYASAALQAPQLNAQVHAQLKDRECSATPSPPSVDVSSLPLTAQLPGHSSGRRSVSYNGQRPPFHGTPQHSYSATFTDHPYVADSAPSGTTQAGRSTSPKLNTRHPGPCSTAVHADKGAPAVPSHPALSQRGTGGGLVQSDSCSNDDDSEAGGTELEPDEVDVSFGFDSTQDGLQEMRASQLTCPVAVRHSDRLSGSMTSSRSASRRYSDADVVDAPQSVQQQRQQEQPSLMSRGSQSASNRDRASDVQDALPRQPQPVQEQSASSLTSHKSVQPVQEQSASSLTSHKNVQLSAQALGQPIEDAATDLVSDSMTTDKLGSILSYLDGVEQSTNDSRVRREQPATSRSAAYALPSSLYSLTTFLLAMQSTNDSRVRREQPATSPSAAYALPSMIDSLTTFLLAMQFTDDNRFTDDNSVRREQPATSNIRNINMQKAALHLKSAATSTCKMLSTNDSRVRREQPATSRSAAYALPSCLYSLTTFLFAMQSTDDSRVRHEQLATSPSAACASPSNLYSLTTFLLAMQYTNDSKSTDDSRVRCERRAHSPSAAYTRPSRSEYTPSSRPSTTSGDVRSLQRPGTAGARHRGANLGGAAPLTRPSTSGASSRRKSQCLAIANSVDGSEAEDQDYGAASDDAVSVDGGASLASVGLSKGAFLAESVYDGVRTKIRRLQDEVQVRDSMIAALKKAADDRQDRAITKLKEGWVLELRHLAADDRQDRAITKLKEGWVQELRRQREGWATAERIKREQWMAAKTQEVKDITVKGLEAEHPNHAAKTREVKDITLKGLEAELPNRTSKARDVKDITVKGLEAEVQKLLARHKSEIQAAQQAAGEEARRQLDNINATHEVALKVLRDKMLKEQEDVVERERVAAQTQLPEEQEDVVERERVGAQTQLSEEQEDVVERERVAAQTQLSEEQEDVVERERVAAQTRLREASERYEQQLQMQRMRLVADADLRLEQIEASKKDERKRYDAAVSKAQADMEEREKRAAEDAKHEREAVARAHEKQMEALREQYNSGQEGWRQAIAERSKKELSERESAFRDKLTHQRNEEIEAIVQRLEAESAMNRDAMKEDFQRREEALVTRHATALKDAKRAEAKYAERFRQAGVAQEGAEERAAAVESSLLALQREVDAKNSTIRWLESQVSSAKEEAHLRENDLRSLNEQKVALQSQAVQVVEQEKEAVQRRLQKVQGDFEAANGKHVKEMNHVEARVKAAIQKKDETIENLRQQLSLCFKQLHETEAVLAQQQEELRDSMSYSGRS
eukprot:gene6342-2967_t